MTDEKRLKILKDEDYIDYPKFKDSIKKLLEKYPDGVSDEIIAKSLNISTQEVQEIYESAIKKLQNTLNL